MSLGFERDIAEERRIKFAKILLDLVFAWGITAVICIAGDFAATVASNSSSLHPTDPPRIIAVFIAILQFGTGAFCLGTLAKKTNIWLLAGLFVFPQLILLCNSGASLTELMQPLCSVALSFVGSICAIAAGQSTPYNREKSALDIPWYHWVWIFPTSLFQIYSLPLTLLFAFINLDQFYAVAEGRLPVRIVILILLPVILMVIHNASKLLSSRSQLTQVQIVALVVSWLFLTVPEVFMLIIQMGKNMGI